MASSPSQQKGPHKELLSAPLETSCWETGRVSLPSLAGGACSGHEANENCRAVGSHLHAKPGQGWLAQWMPARQATAAPQQPGLAPAVGGAPSPAPREGQRPKTVEKREIAEGAGCWLAGFLCFCGLVRNSELGSGCGRDGACSHHGAWSGVKGMILDDAQ